MTADNQQEYSAGDAVSYTTESGQEDIARVRRVYKDSLQLINQRGYHRVPLERIINILGEMIPGTWDVRPKQTPFHREQAIQQYTELMRLISAGAYDERRHDGSYGADGVEESRDRLETQAAQQGLKFIGLKGGPFTLEPMTDEEKAEYQQARESELDQEREQERQGREQEIQARMHLDNAPDEEEE